MSLNNREIITTTNAPAPIGPYSQAIKMKMPLDGFVFTSGQIPIIPATGEIAQGIEAQTRQSLNNIKAILEANGTCMANVIKTTVFLKDMNDFQAMNGVYAEFFDADTAPARSAVEVARLPKDVLVEIEVIASV